MSIPVVIIITRPGVVSNRPMASGNERHEFPNTAAAIDFLKSLGTEVPSSSDPLPPPLPEA